MYDYSTLVSDAYRPCSRRVVVADREAQSQVLFATRHKVVNVAKGSWLGMNRSFHAIDLSCVNTYVRSVIYLARKIRAGISRGDCP